jgi:hypothetical protein
VVERGVVPHEPVPVAAAGVVALAAACCGGERRVEAEVDAAAGSGDEAVPGAGAEVRAEEEEADEPQEPRAAAREASHLVLQPL